MRRGASVAIRLRDYVITLAKDRNVPAARADNGHRTVIELFHHDRERHAAQLVLVLSCPCRVLLQVRVWRRASNGYGLHVWRGKNHLNRYFRLRRLDTRRKEPHKRGA